MFLAILSLFNNRPILPFPLFTLSNYCDKPLHQVAGIIRYFGELANDFINIHRINCRQLIAIFYLLIDLVLPPGDITTSLSPINPSLPILSLASFLINFLTLLFSVNPLLP